MGAQKDTSIKETWSNYINVLATGTAYTLLRIVFSLKGFVHIILHSSPGKGFPTPTGWRGAHQLGFP